MSSSVLTLNDVAVRRGDRLILGPINFSISHGERWVVLGPNGAGKSTLLQILATKIFPTQGTVSVLDKQMGKVQIYEPFKGGLPPVIPYFSDVWRRREFISAYSRSELRAQNFGSFFGQLWLILNPLILAFVYYLLIIVIGGNTGSERFAHLTAGLFLFYFITNSMMAGSKSITSGGKLVLNSAFPRLILPISATVISFFKFLPTFFVLGVIHLILGLPIGPELFYLVPVLVASIIFALGTAILTSILNVYFRDTRNFLPYFTRAWLYLSPVLYTVEQLKPALKPISYSIGFTIFVILDIIISPSIMCCELSFFSSDSCIVPINIGSAFFSCS